MNTMLILALALTASPGLHCAIDSVPEVRNASSTGAAFSDHELQRYLALHMEMLGDTGDARLTPWLQLSRMVEPDAQSSPVANRHFDPALVPDGSHACS